MTSSSRKYTLTDVIKIIREKLSEAKYFVREMEKKKCVPRAFRYRLSAFLSAADSVTEIMERQGTRYAKQKGKVDAYKKWFANKQDLFRAPGEGKNIGTEDVWVYLRAARHQTIHIEQVRPAHLAIKDFMARFRIRDESEPEPPPPPVTVPIQNNMYWIQKAGHN